MSLPITIQMQIDLSAAAHKREIAEGFAKLRERLRLEPAGLRVENCAFTNYDGLLALMAPLVYGWNSSAPAPIPSPFSSYAARGR